ncbi:MAG TPA: carboxymuconolactone decarboxylase family protein [candidate division Zixibacteria bacterium]|jgi:AhpD family alkylhydroperoxidase
MSRRVLWAAVVAIGVLALLGLSQSDAQTGAEPMSREEIYKDMEATLGLVPTFMKTVPDNSLELEWNLLKQVQMAPGAIPNKYRELIGVAISGITKCRYCAYFHTQFAKLNGATDAEIEDALHYAKSSAGWSAYINGMQLDYDQFCKEVDMICGHVRSASAAQGK